MHASPTLPAAAEPSPLTGCWRHASLDAPVVHAAYSLVLLHPASLAQHDAAPLARLVHQRACIGASGKGHNLHLVAAVGKWQGNGQSEFGWLIDSESARLLAYSGAASGKPGLQGTGRSAGRRAAAEQAVHRGTLLSCKLYPAARQPTQPCRQYTQPPEHNAVPLLSPLLGAALVHALHAQHQHPLQLGQASLPCGAHAVQQHISPLSHTEAAGTAACRSRRGWRVRTNGQLLQLRSQLLAEVLPVAARLLCLLRRRRLLCTGRITHLCTAASPPGPCGASAVNECGCVRLCKCRRDRLRICAFIAEV